MALDCWSIMSEEVLNRVGTNLLENRQTALVTTGMLTGCRSVHIFPCRIFGLGWYPEAVGRNAEALIMMLLTHTSKNRLLIAILIRAELLLGTMSNTLPTLHGHFGAPIRVTPLPSGAVGAAQASLLNILVASWMLAGFAPGSVLNAKSTLHNTIGTILNGTLASNTLACTTGGKLRFGLLRV
jgi:hypothetical protein